MNRNLAVAALLAFVAAGPVLAQSAAPTVQRDIHQQQRIQQGLQNGAITTREAAALQRGEARVDHLQAKALKDGTLTGAEAARLDAAQDKTSHAIAAAAHNSVTGDPGTASSQRIQADVQRNIRQDQRIQQGLQSGELTHHEAARLERGQAQVHRQQARAGRDGHVGAHEQRHVQHAQNHQSRRIHRQKHDGQQR
ncbi:MAG: hypothetical protein AB1430_16670 [Pseudomonadota bacterium]